MRMSVANAAQSPLGILDAMSCDLEEDLHSWSAFSDLLPVFGGRFLAEAIHDRLRAEIFPSRALGHSRV